MVEPVTHITVPGIAPKATTVEPKQGNEATAQDRDVRSSKEDSELDKDKQREHRRLAALEELHDEIMAQAGVHADAALKIEEDAVTGRPVFMAVDKASGEVIRQFPSEEILKSVRWLQYMSGVLVDQRA